LLVQSVWDDTNELTANQDRWLTATGFSTEAQVAVIGEDIGKPVDLGSGATIAKNLNDIYTIGNLSWATATGFATDAQGSTIIASIGTVQDLGSGATLAFNNRDIAGATFVSSTDSNEAISDKITAGGCDLTGIALESTSQEILAGQQELGSRPSVWNSHAAMPNHIEITRGIAYDGVSQPTFTWDAGQDIDGKRVFFTVRNSEDDDTATPIFEQESLGVGNEAIISLETDNTNMFPKSETPCDQKFDVVVEMNANSYLGVVQKGTCTTTDSVTYPPEA
jgi:hypothetical protein